MDCRLFVFCRNKYLNILVFFIQHFYTTTRKHNVVSFILLKLLSNHDQVFDYNSTAMVRRDFVYHLGH